MHSILVRRVWGDSMEPAVHAGQVIIASSLRAPKPGRLVVFKHNGIEKIKRVARIDSEGVWVLGDNAPYSTDSRDFGHLDSSNILATVLIVW